MIADRVVAARARDLGGQGRPRAGRCTARWASPASAARRWTTRRTTSSRSCSPRWARCRSRTRPVFDTPPRSPVWGPPSAVAAPPTSSRTWSTPTASSSRARTWPRRTRSGFQWVMEAKERGAKVIHVDPRFTRTSALADTYVPLRAGTDIAFLGGIINHVLQNELDFREYVVAYTNAATIVSEDFRDTEDLDGLFSGFDPETRTYDPATLAVRRAGGRPATRPTRARAPRRPPRPAARVARRAAPGAHRARRDPAAPALRLPDPQAALRPLHAGDGRAGLRRPARAVRARCARRGRPTPAASGPPARLLGRLDPAHRRRAVHPHRRHPPAAARQRRPARRRHHGAARPRQHPGLDRHPDAVQPAARLPADAAPRAARDVRSSGSTTSATPGRRASGATPGRTRSACSRRTGATPRPPTTTSATTTCPG